MKAGAQITLAAAHMPPLESTAVLVDKTIALYRRDGVNIGNVLLNREFSGDIIMTLERAGVGHLIPCPNTPGVVAAIREFVVGRWSDASAHAIVKSHGERVPHTMIIVARQKKRRKTKSSPNPEDVYIVFATNRPNIDINTPSGR